MRTLRFPGVAFLLLSFALFSSSCSKKPAATESGEKTLYTCGMHPQIIRDKPGDCPICGMKLTPLRKQPGIDAAPADAARKVKYYKSTMLPGETRKTPGKDNMGMDMVPVYDEPEKSGVISIEARTIQEMGVRTALVARGPLVKDIRALARIDFNETTVSDVNVRESGWIEKLYVDSVGMLVHRGQPLFDFFSPELLVAQKEYLLAIERGAAYAAQTIVKMHNVGISDSQIAQLQKTGQAQQVIQVESPRDGFVVSKNAVVGQMVERGANLYRIADLATVWVFADIYESDLPFIKVGQPATVRLSYLPDRSFSGRVTYIYPTVDEKTRAVRVRMEFYNPGYFLKPGMYATAQIHAELAPDAVLVPDMAVLRSGERNTVFVALGGGKFEPREVSLGAQGADEMYQVIDGLKPGERVVTSGQFLLDSESQLREAVQKMSAPEDAQTEEPAQVAKEKAPASPENAATRTDYICPMPEHVSIRYDHPGKCPICGMALVPVQAAASHPSASHAEGDH